jgi:hypothetical protein
MKYGRKKKKQTDDASVRFTESPLALAWKDELPSRGLAARSTSRQPAAQINPLNPICPAPQQIGQGLGLRQLSSVSLSNISSVKTTQVFDFLSSPVPLPTQ